MSCTPQHRTFTYTALSSQSSQESSYRGAAASASRSFLGAPRVTTCDKKVTARANCCGLPLAITTLCQVSKLHRPFLVQTTRHETPPKGHCGGRVTCAHCSAPLNDYYNKLAALSDFARRDQRRKSLYRSSAAIAVFSSQQKSSAIAPQAIRTTPPSHRQHGFSHT